MRCIADRQTDKTKNGSRDKSGSAGQSPSIINYTCTCRKNENEIRIQARKPRAHHHPQRNHRRKGKKSERKGHFVPIMPTAQCKPHRTGTLQKTATIQRHSVPNTATSTIVSRGCAKKKMALLPFTEPAIPQRNCYLPPHWVGIPPPPTYTLAPYHWRRLYR